MTLSTIEGGSNMLKGGPATQEGKEVVKWNAVQHGIRSPEPVVPGVEKKEDWEDHRETACLRAYSLRGTWSLCWLNG
jgi:hypothetical protein